MSMEKLGKFKHEKKKSVSTEGFDFHTIRETLDKLEKGDESIFDMNSKGRRKVAEHPETPPEILILLAQDSRRGVRWAVVNNPNTPPEVLDNPLAVGETSRGIRRAVAQNVRALPTTLDRLADDKRRGVRRDIAMNPSTSSETLRKMAKKEKRRNVRHAIAENPKTPSDALAELAKTRDEYVCHAIAANPNVRPKTAKKIAEIVDRARSREEDVSRAKNSTSPEELHEIVEKHGDVYAICEAVTDNEKILPKKETLRKLAESEDLDIIRMAAKNENTPVGVLAEILKKHGDERYIRHTIAENTVTPSWMLNDIYSMELPGGTDGDEGVLRAIAKNGNTTEDILGKLSKHPNAHVRRTIAKNKNTSSEILSDLANDRSQTVRFHVAEHLNTPLDVLKNLLKFAKDPDVCHAAKKSIKRIEEEEKKEEG